MGAADGIWQRAVPAALVLAMLVMTGCNALSPRSSLTPQTRPPGLGAQAPAPLSEASLSLARYYGAVQSDLLSQGLLRTDGGGPDTPFDSARLARNFETIAFFDEYTRAGGTTIRNSGVSGRLTRWAGPVRIGIEFGNSVPGDVRRLDRGRISAYAQRLARVSGHPIGVNRASANFHVFVAGEDDRDFVLDRLRQLIPSISRTELDLFANLPRSFYCLVVAAAVPDRPNELSRAVALIRAEHPDLVRHSCIHEEIAQGLGLPNDSPYVRPSIFNDDDEFALLTRHDEFLIKMLYDPRLESGMTAEEARPIAQTIAAELLAADL